MLDRRGHVDVDLRATESVQIIEIVYELAPVDAPSSPPRATLGETVIEGPLARTAATVVMQHALGRVGGVASMFNPYSPPESELLDPSMARGSRPGWLARAFALVLGIVALFAWLVAGFGVFQFVGSDGLQLEEGLALLVLLAFAVFWLFGGCSWWRGGRRAWLWVLAPFLVMGALFVVLVIWELAVGLPA